MFGLFLNYRGDEKIFKNSVLTITVRGNLFQVIPYFYPTFLFRTLFQYFQKLMYFSHVLKQWLALSGASMGQSLELFILLTWTV